MTRNNYFVPDKLEVFKPSNVYLLGHIKGRAVHALLDAGSDVSLAPYDLVEMQRC